MLNKISEKTLSRVITFILFLGVISPFLPFFCRACAPRMEYGYFAWVQGILVMIGMAIGAGGKLGWQFAILTVVYFVIIPAHDIPRFWWHLSRDASLLAVLYWLIALITGLLFGFGWRLNAAREKSKR